MKIKVFWDNVNIMDIVKTEKAYITSVNHDNFIQANKLGMPFSIFLNYNLVSSELPSFVKNRLPTPKIISKEIDRNNLDANISIIDYINKTKCKCATDKFEMIIEE